MIFTFFRNLILREGKRYVSFILLGKFWRKIEEKEYKGSMSAGVDPKILQNTERKNNLLISRGCAIYVFDFCELC